MAIFRLRESAYYGIPENTLALIWTELKRMGIEPLHDGRS